MNTNNSGSKWTSRMVAFVCLLILVGLDQLSKYVAVVHLKNKKPISFLGDRFELFYLENHGAAWGILAGKTGVLITITVVVLAVLCVLYDKIPTGKHYLLLKLCMMLIVSGAVGNMIDRCIYQYVIDFLYVKMIDFPVFNVADIYVTVGAFLLVYAILFIYEDNDFSFFKKTNLKD